MDAGFRRDGVDVQPRGGAGCLRQQIRDLALGRNEERSAFEELKEDLLDPLIGLAHQFHQRSRDGFNGPGGLPESRTRQDPRRVLDRGRGEVFPGPFVLDGQGGVSKEIGEKQQLVCFFGAARVAFHLTVFGTL